MRFKLRPLSDRVVVLPDQPGEMSAGGLHIPQIARDAERPQTGTVIEVGPGKVGEESFESLKDPAKRVWPRKPMVIKEGDRVLFGKYGGAEIQIDRDKVLIIRQTDIFCVLEERDESDEH